MAQCLVQEQTPESTGGLVVTRYHEWLLQQLQTRTRDRDVKKQQKKKFYTVLQRGQHTITTRRERGARAQGRRGVSISNEASAPKACKAAGRWALAPIQAALSPNSGRSNAPRGAAHLCWGPQQPVAAAYSKHRAQVHWHLAPRTLTNCAFSDLACQCPFCSERPRRE